MALIVYYGFVLQDLLDGWQWSHCTVEGFFRGDM